MPTREQLLAHLWNEVINPNLRADGLHNILRECARHADGPFGDTGAAIRRMLDAAVSPRDLGLFARATAYEAVFGVLYALSDPGVDGDDVLMLHESLLGADPSGLEGRPGSAEAAP